MTGIVAQSNWKKLLLQMLAGAVVGGASTGAILYAFDGRGLNTSDPAQLLAIVTGMIYALIGFIVGVGAVVPAAGARFLNVADIDDLRDQRVILGLSSVACMAIGLLFLILATVHTDDAGGFVSREAAAVMAGGCLAAMILLTRLTNRRVDELTRHISMEASSLAMQVGFILFGGWAALAHLGFVQWMGPLAFVAGMALLQLLAIFWVCGKRGLIVPHNVT